MNDIQAKKLAKYLKADVGTIKHYYQNSVLLKGFYECVLKKKNW